MSLFSMVIEGHAFPVGMFSGCEAHLNRITCMPHGKRFAITGHFWRGYEEWFQLWERKPKLLTGGDKWVYVAAGDYSKLVERMELMLAFDKLAKGTP